MEFNNTNCDLGVITKGSKHEVKFPFVGSKDEIVKVQPACFDSDTDVMTNEGWKNWKIVNGSEKFLSVNPITKDLSWETASKLIKEDYVGDMVYLHNNTFNLMTTPDHNHVINKYSKIKNYNFYKYDQLLDTHCLIRAGFKWNGSNPDFKEIGNLKIPFDIYCKFMGWYLSEGSCFQKKNRPNLHAITIAQMKQENISEILNLLELFFGKKPFSGKKDHGLYIDNELGKFFTQFGHSYDKFVPEDIKNSTVNNINHFLTSFNKGDGSVRKNKQRFGYPANPEILYFTSSNRLASDICEMTLKLGKTVSYTERLPIEVTHKNGKYTAKSINYSIRELGTKTVQMKNLKKEIVKYDGTIHSVTLNSNNTLIVRRNGKVCLSGNCSCTADCVVEDDCVVAVYTEDSKLGGNYKDQYPSGYYPFQKNITVYLKDNEDLQIQTAAGIVYNPNKKYQTLTFTGKVQL